MAKFAEYRKKKEKYIEQLRDKFGDNWISVKEHLPTPEFGFQYLVYYVKEVGFTIPCISIKRNAIIIANYEDGRWNGLLWIDSKTVTHWRLLPEPPEDDSHA